MATRSKGANKGSLPIPAVIGAIVIILALIGWLAYRNLGPAPLPPEHPSQGATRIFKIFKDSGGDWDKVSPSDKEWIHQFSGGKEAMAWASMKNAKAAQH